MDLINTNTTNIPEDALAPKDIGDLRNLLKDRLNGCLVAGDEVLRGLKSDDWGTYCSTIVRNNRIRYLLATLDDKPYTEEDISKMLQEYKV